MYYLGFHQWSVRPGAVFPRPESLQRGTENYHIYDLYRNRCRRAQEYLGLESPIGKTLRTLVLPGLERHLGLEKRMASLRRKEWHRYLEHEGED